MSTLFMSDENSSTNRKHTKIECLSVKNTNRNKFRKVSNRQALNLSDILCRVREHRVRKYRLDHNGRQWVRKTNQNVEIPMS